MAISIENALHRGVAAHKAGKLKEAERHYRAILKSQPLHPDANHNLGLIAVAFNKVDAAIPLFKNAIEANSKIEQYWISYINALVKLKKLNAAKQAIKTAKKNGVNAKKLDALLLNSEVNTDIKIPSQAQLNRLLECYQKGHFDEAEKLALSITQEFPKHPFSWKVLGAILKQTGRVLESLTPSQKAVELSPQDAEIHNNLATTLNELKQLEKAEASFRQAIALKPNYVEAHNNLGGTLLELEELDKAEGHFRKAINLRPDYAEAHNSLGLTLKELGRLGEAEASYRKAISLKPDFAKAYNNLGVILAELGRLDEAEVSYKKAISLKPDFAEIYSNLGVSLKEQGRLNEARENYNQTLMLKPDYAVAHRHLSLLKTYDAYDEQFLKMQELYDDKDMSEEELCHINFGLAKAYEDLGEYEKAFAHYIAGNALRKKLLNYDISQDEELFKQIKTTYPQIAHTSLELDISSQKITPIFIVGMPRSGTTLVEQIISSHSEVTGAGELPFATQFGAPIVRGFSEANDASILQFRNKYLEKLKSVSAGNLIVTDKMPQNFRFIGLLSAAFPEAKIIHIKRNPAAVCWANFKQYFTSKGISYSNDIYDILRYHELYQNLMTFWEIKLSNRIYTLDYEQLTVNPEKETRQLIKSLDLEWDEKCLSPQNNSRIIKTASSLQVRKKIYRGSSEQWKKYQQYLNGAFDSLLHQ
ncbi:MAG: tetratricopeptide repeat protein [Alphaproteobacteria bacterium]|nr:tetratricopeptide repeat protein [Alphaproteobacteria bacterium]